MIKDLEALNIKKNIILFIGKDKNNEKQGEIKVIKLNDNKKDDHPK